MHAFSQGPLKTLIRAFEKEVGDPSDEFEELDELEVRELEVSIALFLNHCHLAEVEGLDEHDVG